MSCLTNGGITVDPARIMGNGAKDKVGKKEYQYVPLWVFDYASCDSVGSSFFAYMRTDRIVFLYGVLRHFKTYDIIERVQSVRDYGVQKYNDPDNWEYVPVSDFKNAAMRHLVASTQEDEDKESGLPHISHFLCNIVFILQKSNRPF